MSSKSSFPAPISILMVVIILSAISTWLLPAGEYSKLTSIGGNAFHLTTASSDTTLRFSQHTLDSLGVGISIQKFVDGDIRKPISVPGTYQRQESKPQGFLSILQAPIKGIYDSIDIIIFVLFIGGFMYVFNETGAMLKGITWLSYTMKGRERWLIIILTTILS